MNSWGKRVREESVVKGKMGAYLSELFQGPGMVFTGVVAREVG